MLSACVALKKFFVAQLYDSVNYDITINAVTYAIFQI